MEDTTRSDSKTDEGATGVTRREFLMRTTLVGGGLVLYPRLLNAGSVAGGEKVELTANGATIQAIVNIDKSVVAGTVQAIRGLADSPVNALTAGTTPVAVTVAKLAVEVAD